VGGGGETKRQCSPVTTEQSVVGEKEFQEERKKKRTKPIARKRQPGPTLRPRRGAKNGGKGEIESGEGKQNLKNSPANTVGG